MKNNRLDEPSLYSSLFKGEALLIDFYELTQAQALFEQKKHEDQAVFHLFFRTPPFEENFTLACGLLPALSFLESFQFSEEDLFYLKGLTQKGGKPFFTEDFLTYLANLRFNGDLFALPEGTPVFPYEPLLRIEGSFLLLQLLESILLNLINFSTLIATKALRVSLVADKSEVIEFGLRRAQGPNGALLATRSCFIGGIKSTSNTLAGKLFGIPVQGTHAHSFVMAFTEEKEAFKAYSNVFPDNTTLLVDTYNTVEGVKKAIEIADKLKEEGHTLLGIRLDSGDLATLSKKARSLLDEASLFEVKIIVSSDLDEYKILKLKEQKAPIDVFGVGTRLVVSKDQPSLDGVYKLSALKSKEEEKWNPLVHYKIKLSENLEKSSLPGRLNILRKIEGGKVSEDLLFDEEQNPEWIKEALLKPYILKGEKVFTCLSFEETSLYVKNQLKAFSFDASSLFKPFIHPFSLNPPLKQLNDLLIKKKGPL